MNIFLAPELGKATTANPTKTMQIDDIFFSRYCPWLLATEKNHHQELNVTLITLPDHWNSCQK